MIFPFVIQLGQAAVPIHLLTDIISLYAGWQFYLYLKSKTTDHLSFNNRWFVIIGGLAGGFLGSRILASLENPYLFLHPPEITYYLASKTIVGGLFGAILGVEIIKKIIKEKQSSGDIFVYPLILALIIGRVGCFLTGVSDGTVGNASNLPWAFNQGDGVPRHPTSLYEIIFLGLLWIVLYQINKKSRLQHGTLFRLFIIGYALFRFLVEFIKPTLPLALGLGAIQWVCLIAAVYYIIMLTRQTNLNTIKQTIQWI
jgi:prolipoprotein diacylglyceryltransferase